MKQISGSTISVLKLMGKKGIQFAMMMVYIILYSQIFGESNILAGITILIGFLTFPKLRIGVAPGKLAWILFGLYTGMAFSAHFSYMNLFMAILIPIVTLSTILFLFCEPILQKPYYPFLIGYVFLQGNPVSGRDFTLRVLSLVLGGIVIALFSYFKWKKIKTGQMLTIKEQIKRSAKNKGFLFRTISGLTAAIFLGELFSVSKPMWISIVVMSLTQPDLEEVKKRFCYRFGATVMGSVLFLGIFGFLVPEKAAFLIILLLGYLGTFDFFKQYRHQQILSVINALFASLVLFDLAGAVLARFQMFFLGAFLVFLFLLLEKGMIVLTSYLQKELFSSFMD